MSNNGETSSAFGYTQVKVAKFKYTWTINNFRFYCEDASKGLSSPTFSTDSNNELTWYLEIFPRIYTNTNSNSSNYYHSNSSTNTTSYVDLYLKLMSSDLKKPVKVECKISILNGEGSIVLEDITDGILFKKSGYSNTLSFPKLIELSVLLDNLKALTLNQTISIICELCASSESENLTNQIDIAEPDLRDPLELLFENPQFSDITLSSNGTDFKVHKAILASQSLVFEAMFNVNMKEKFNNRVEITDFNEVTLRELLRFIYTGKVLNLQEMAEDLLSAADKYALRKLKVTCERELIKKLSITNALSIFTLADMHSANHLKSYVKKFIHNHLLDVVKTSEWKMLVQQHPKLAVEVFDTQ